MSELYQFLENHSIFLSLLIFIFILIITWAPRIIYGHIINKMQLEGLYKDALAYALLKQNKMLYSRFQKDGIYAYIVINALTLDDYQLASEYIDKISSRSSRQAKMYLTILYCILIGEVSKAEEIYIILSNYRSTLGKKAIHYFKPYFDYVLYAKSNMEAIEKLKQETKSPILIRIYNLLSPND